MNLLRLFCICILSFIIKASSSIVTETDSLVNNSEIEELDPSPSFVRPEQYSSLLMLPEALIYIIFSYVKLPWKVFDQVCFALRKCMNHYGPLRYLNSIAVNPELWNQLSLNDVNTLVNVDSSFLQKDRFKIIIDSIAQFELDSPILMNKYIEQVYSKYEIILEREGELAKQTVHLMKFDCFDSFLMLMRTGYRVKIAFEFPHLYRFVRQILRDEQSFPDNLTLLMNYLDDPYKIIKIVLSFPNLPHFEYVKYLITSIPCESNALLFSIASSFSVIKSKEETEGIITRNFDFIDEYSRQASSEDLGFDVKFAKLCGKMMLPFNKADEAYLVFELLECITLIPLNLKCKFLSLVLRIALKKRGLINVIKAIVNSKIYNPQRFKIKSFNHNHEFIESLPFDLFIKIFGSDDPIGLIKYKKFLPQLLSYVKDRQDLILIKLEMNYDCKTEITELLQECSPAELFYRIGSKCTNPSDKILMLTSILEEDENFIQFDKQKSKNHYINPDYLYSLIKPSSKYSVKIELEGFAPLLKILMLNWNTLISTSNYFRAHDYEAFFKGIGLKIEESEFITKQTRKSMQTDKIINSIIDDSRILFRNPEIYSKYLYEVLLKVAYESFLQEYSSSFHNNPFKFHSCGMYEFLMESNMEYFLWNAPVCFISILQPSVNYLLLKKVLLDPLSNEPLSHIIFMYCYPPNSLHTISISTLQELEIYYSTFYPTLHENYPSIFYLKVFVDWETIITTSNDFQIIIETLSREEFDNSKWKSSDKIDSFKWAYLNSGNIAGSRIINKDLIEIFSE